MDPAIRFCPSAPNEPGSKSSDAACRQGEPSLKSIDISMVDPSCICRDRDLTATENGISRIALALQLYQQQSTEHRGHVAMDRGHACASKSCCKGSGRAPSSMKFGRLFCMARHFEKGPLCSGCGLPLFAAPGSARIWFLVCQMSLLKCLQPGAEKVFTSMQNSKKVQHAL